MPFFFEWADVPQKIQIPSGEPLRDVGPHTGQLIHGQSRLEVSRSTSLEVLKHAVETSEGQALHPPIWVVVDGYLQAMGEATESNLADTPADRIACLIREQGLKGLDSVSGCFVIAVIESGSGRVFLRRDRLGGRTAYWHKGVDRFIVGSSSSEVAKSLPRATADEQWLSHWFGLRWPGRPGLSAFEGVVELLPGEEVIFADQSVERRRRPFQFGATAPSKESGDWIDRFNRVFRESVSACLTADSRTAMMLSGGMDSGPTACVAAECLGDQDRTLNVVSWGLPGSAECDEAAYIRELARYLQHPLDLFDGTSHSPYDRLDTGLIHADFPTFNVFRGLVLECYRRAEASGSSVILNAACGDRVYPPRNTQLADLWDRGHWASAARFLAERFRARGPSGTWRDPNFRYWAKRFAGPFRSRRDRPPPEWLQPSAVGSLPDHSPWPAEAQMHELPEFAEQLIGQAMAGGLAHENAFSQRYGLDRRDPFHNEALVRLMLQMPVSMSFRGGTDKWVMREAMRGKMPESFRTKGRTGLLNSFLEEGFSRNRGRLEDFLFREHKGWQEWVRPEYVRSALRDHNPPDKGRMVVGQCVGYSLWLQRLGEEGVVG